MEVNKKLQRFLYRSYSKEKAFCFFFLHLYASPFLSPTTSLSPSLPHSMKNPTQNDILVQISCNVIYLKSNNWACCCPSRVTSLVWICAASLNHILWPTALTVTGTTTLTHTHTHFSNCLDPAASTHMLLAALTKLCCGQIERLHSTRQARGTRGGRRGKRGMQRVGGGEERRERTTGNKQTNKLSFGSGCLYKRTHSRVQQNELNINIQADTHTQQQHTHIQYTHKHCNMTVYITVFFWRL